ncbi:hypothetical protein [Micromonospora avicenniae]|uniref:hypothetical protein n=1 Tax=Micromonospora avicenniae TaxID=1198245 RepID=UPI00341D03FD
MPDRRLKLRLGSTEDFGIGLGVIGSQFTRACCQLLDLLDLLNLVGVRAAPEVGLSRPARRPPGHLLALDGLPADLTGDPATACSDYAIAVATAGEDGFMSAFWIVGFYGAFHVAAAR